MADQVHGLAAAIMWLLEQTWEEITFLEKRQR